MKKEGKIIKRNNKPTFDFQLSTFRQASGFTFIETLISVTIFIFVILSIFEAYSVLVRSARLSRLRVTATMIGNEQLEIVRNLPYDQVGTIGGVPSGIIEPDRVVDRDGVNFNIKTTIRNKDDVFDGTINGIPSDSSPADYKIVDVNVNCPVCGVFPSIDLTTTISPKNLETTSNNGALFVNVFDALGQVVSGADVEIINNLVEPQINLTDVTGTEGSLQLIDVPPSNQSYQINITKDGYSSDNTYPITISNPNPTKPHATIASKQVTQISFSIDKTSTLNVSTVTATCTSTPNIGFNLSGAKLIGTNPDVFKYNTYNTTDANSFKMITNLEWDSYTVSIPVTPTSTHFLAGTLSMSPLSILPDTNTNLTIITTPKIPNGLLVSTKDISSGLPIAGATVELTGNGYSVTKTTGRGSQSQSDWSLGSGQSDFYDFSKYFYSENINTSNGIRLASILSEYELNGYLESSTFDSGSASNFYNLSWGPIDQPVATGEDSVKFQIATNNNKSSWNFLGPDGTSNTYYNSSGDTINSIHNGDRYLRYRVYLKTDNVNFTPNVSGVSFSYTSACVPSGQVFFDGLEEGTYQLKINKDNYNEEINDSLFITSEWQESLINMSPL